MVIPRDRHTHLFSATMTSKVAKLQRAALKAPVKVEVSHKFQTVKTLVQQYLFIPAKHKDCYLAYVLNEYPGKSALIFTSTVNSTTRTTLLLRQLGMSATCLHGQMAQPKRLGALNKFKAGSRNILVATDVASRGLDIPSVDLVINFDVPQNGKDYVRCGMLCDTLRHALLLYDSRRVTTILTFIRHCLVAHSYLPLPSPS